MASRTNSRAQSDTHAHTPVSHGPEPSARVPAMGASLGASISRRQCTAKGRGCHWHESSALQGGTGTWGGGSTNLDGDKHHVHAAFACRRVCQGGFFKATCAFIS
jgi:hypothetical protein